jgi:hypothetical protein
MSKHRTSITITLAENGWIVQVGCLMLVFSDWSEINKEFLRWTQNPDDVEKEYLEKYRPLQARIGSPIIDKSDRDLMSVVRNPINYSQEMT